MTAESPAALIRRAGTRNLADIFTNYRDGDEIGWAAEFAWLRTFHAERIADLTVDIAENGFNEPITLGSDGRVWDGHHRLCVAHALRYKAIPVRYAEDEDTSARSILRETGESDG